MSDETKAEKKRGRSGRRATWLLLVVVAYVLSYAPYNRFRYGPYDFAVSKVNVVLVPDGSPDFGDTLYAPVEWLIDHTPFEKPLTWWADL